MSEAVPVPNRGPQLTSVAIFLIILPTASVILRFVSRYLSKAGLWWDDWLILLALPASLGLDIEILYGVHHGFGKHVVDGPPDGTIIFIKLLYGAQILYNTCLTLCKLSLLLFYYRVFSPVRPFRIALAAAGVLCVAWFLSMTIAAIFGCSPASMGWIPRVTGEGHCTNLAKFFIGQSVPNVITDFILLLLPVPMLWRLRVMRYQKVALIGVFALGYFVPVISAIRLVYIVELGAKSQEDLTWNIVSLFMWSCSEPAVAIVSTSIPSISYLLKRAVRAVETHVSADSRGRAIFRGSEPNSSGNTKNSRQSHKISNNGDFVKLKELPTTSTSPLSDDSVQPMDNNYTFAVQGQDLESAPGHTGFRRQEDPASNQQIHVRQDLDVTHEFRA